MPRFNNITNKRFDRLVALKREKRDRWGQWQWRCQCDCGGTAVVCIHSLVKGNTRSCGCLKKEMDAKRSLIHGHNRKGKKTKTYHSWVAMWSRYRYPYHPSYKNYGGRGIKICKRWAVFKNFLVDMGERPIGTTLDRYPDNDGNYKPSNCRWATKRQQARNRRPKERGTSA